MINNKQLQNFQEKLKEILVNQCSSKGFLDGTLLEIEELDQKWDEMAPQYMVDAVPLVNDYPAVAIAWAAYLGMGLASIWDGAWDEYCNRQELYALIRDPRGFDAMDEYVMEELLGSKIDSEHSKQFEDLLRGCAHTAMTMIRNERIEPQSTDAFYIFAYTVKLFFKLGVAMELKELGYEYRKMKIPIES